jgi:hypothetical protein
VDPEKVVEILGEPLNACQHFLGILNLMTDLRWAPPDLERDEDYCRPTGAGLLECDACSRRFLRIRAAQRDARIRRLERPRYNGA